MSARVRLVDVPRVFPRGTIVTQRVCSSVEAESKYAGFVHLLPEIMDDHLSLSIAMKGVLILL
jgi:hypothetical protein